ncbi:hypothetical protein [Motiliproteus sp. MSK22-1]|uniref:hypothetical protein n=1 Tax=Motiliproteus sp. MSK22-1 TaxID=1897630 RepID=UPI000977B803|nr:hypothetical protein [Motiliproteus sp. MSK22-1]OMH33607.1 hypothetical protein BGP75_11330 [Motiliproteus sp. MSK22-1]OMH33610.1 hypothetical protein BGP75_11345 [Motiliproteus sp. MSK22-1]
MALSASLKIVNHTSYSIKITSVEKVNDDSTFAGIDVGDVIASDGSETLAMGNSSVFIAPKGCGADIGFVIGDTNMDLGAIRLDIPAVGAHSFSYGNESVVSYDTTNPSGNNYEVAVGLK